MSSLEKMIEETREALNKASEKYLENSGEYVKALTLSKYLDKLINEYYKKHYKHN